MCSMTELHFLSVIIRPGGGGGKRHSAGKFLKPSFLAQFWGADFENLCYMAI